MAFKVGDRVAARVYLPDDGDGSCSKYVGETGTVIKVRPGKPPQYDVRWDRWNEEWLYMSGAGLILESKYDSYLGQ